MTDRKSRERLVELLTDNLPRCGNLPYWDNPLQLSCDEQVERIADHLIANGVIVLSCKVGDKIYFVVEYDGKHFLDEGEVGSVYKDNGGVWVSARYDSGLHYHHKESDFGKTVFLTREEAEEKLREKKEDERK